MSETSMSQTVGAVIVAAGRSTRMDGIDKTFASVGGRPLVAWSLAAFAAAPEVTRIALVLRSDLLEQGAALVASRGLSERIVVCAGGERRQDSVAAGLAALGDCDWVLIHDGARPGVTPGLIRAALEAARETGAAVPGLAVTDTLKRVDATERILSTVDRGALRAVQTPQAFRYAIIAGAYAEAEDVTDDAALVESRGVEVRVFPGLAANLKVTTNEDIALAEHYLNLNGEDSETPPVTVAAPQTVAVPEPAVEQRVGFGYDGHQLADGERLVLGGVAIPWDQGRGLAGYSDADVLIHAVIDALLGAAGLGDIGRHFPSGDPRYRGIASTLLLEHTRGLLADAGWRTVNVDSTVVAQAPRLSPHVAAMQTNLAGVLGVPADRCSVKAKTTDGLGFAGRGEGMAAYAVALIERRAQREIS
ncbi:MAG: 2-C-methyl-D-erythritol 4-phosphate cytidylyltransferase [Chloroflexi bacterium]|nr:2-C-methyl-D-erythritol 4-phosphate cytidylyltransferase [Chloroflexota bacterium]